jgi:hypothetical protein
MDTETSPTGVRAIAWAVMQYLHRHPQAADTAAGIQRWWLAPTMGEVSIDDVEQALEQLVAGGQVARRDSAWSATTYGLAMSAPAEGRAHGAAGAPADPPADPPADATAAPAASRPAALPAAPAQPPR